MYYYTCVNECMIEYVYYNIRSTCVYFSVEYSFPRIIPCTENLHVRTYVVLLVL